MGRGLSDLQKVILRRAYRNLDDIGPTSDYPNAHLYPYEVLEEHWGWEPDQRLSINKASRFHAAWGQNFSRSKIGAARYDAAHAALSRAARRLEARGFLIVGNDIEVGAQFNLTPAGIEEARQLAGPLEFRADADRLRSQYGDLE